MVATNYSFGIERDEAALKRNNLDHTKWSNPLEVQYVNIQHLVANRPLTASTRRLPFAPSMKIYCVYGVGKETEVRIFFDARQLVSLTARLLPSALLLVRILAIHRTSPGTESLPSGMPEASMNKMTISQTEQIPCALSRLMRDARAHAHRLICLYHERVG